MPVHPHAVICSSASLSIGKVEAMRNSSEGARTIAWFMVDPSKHASQGGGKKIAKEIKRAVRKHVGQQGVFAC